MKAQHRIQATLKMLKQSQGFWPTKFIKILDFDILLNYSIVHVVSKNKIQIVYRSLVACIHQTFLLRNISIIKFTMYIWLFKIVTSPS